MVAETSAPNKAMTSMYALGWTQHSKGSQNIRAMAMLQLILGNIGVRGGGMNALRGHSNIQGLTDIGLMSNLLPGYLTLPTEKEVDFDKYMSSGGFNDVDSAKIDTEVIQLPSTCFAEDEGSLSNSGRWLQWHWAAGTPPGEAKRDTWIMAQIYQRLKALYQKEGGALPDPIVNLS